MEGDSKDIVGEIMAAVPDAEKPRLARLKSGEELDYLIRARYPLIYVVSPEEDRGERTLRELKGVKRAGKRLLSWTITRGWQGPGVEAAQEIRDPDKALEYVINTELNGIFVLRDFHPYLKAPTIVRRLRDMREHLKATTKTCIILAPILSLPQELEKEVAVVDFDLPDREELGRIRDRVLHSVAGDPKIAANLDDRQRAKIA